MSPLFLLAFVAAAPAAETVRPQDTWDFSAVYPSLEAWEAALKRTTEAVGTLAACEGHVAEQLKPCLDKRFGLLETASRVHSYASNLSAGDTRDAAWLSRAQQAEQLLVQLDEASAFYRPEIIKMGTVAVEAAIQKDPALKPYDYYLRSIARDAPHTLDAAGEGTLASMGGLLAAPSRLHSVLVNAELPWPTVTLADGAAVRLDPSGYTDQRGSPVRADRKLVMEAYFGALQGYRGVLGGLLDTAVQGDWLMARSRNYPTSVAAAVDTNHLPPAVYETLVARTNANLPTLHRYLALRGRMLGITDLAYYDLYPPLVNLQREWTLDQGRDLTIEATRPLGAEYTAAMTAGFANRWMDAFPRQGKVGGAYMDGGVPSVHPFVLMNYTGDYESVSTLAHEWGHALHSVLSAKAQPYPKADYATFLAEIASTFNEAMLLETMLKKSTSDDEKLYYLGMALEGLRTTYFRQSQFAEFELAIHTQVEKGEPLTGDSLSATYLDLLERYYGAKQGVTRIDPVDGNEWAFIPHFYYNFYVYQYATSIAAASLLAEDVINKKPGALDRYLTLLKAGGSDDPYVLLKSAGVDMATPAPYDAIARRMNRIMDEMEAILAKKAGKPAPKKGKK